jgi:NADH-quinone oxidoreductase subunit C
VAGYTHNFNIFTITQNFIPNDIITTYNILSLKHSQNIILLATPETKKDAITAVYPGSVFYERELQEMFGLRLRNLKDSRTLLLDYNNTTTPLLKENPVWGVEEVTYSKKYERLCFLQSNIFTL